MQAVVFDIGETLVDESRLWREWADWLGVSHSVIFALLGAAIERGEHHRRVFESLRPGFVLEEAREQRRRAGIPDAFDARDLYGDVETCFRALKERGLRIGIAANQPRQAEQALAAIGLPVDFIASSAGWGVEKPAAVFFQRIVDEVGLPAAEIAYVGDRLDNDVLPARAAGMFSVFLRRGPWGFIHALRPEAALADIRIDTLLQLSQAL
jgi:HAD superfamily hydrolase (TIGR01549 family)